MKYPIGIQTFEKIRNSGFVYVDKTALVYKLADEGQYYLLSRPRRFGKSLLQSTLRAYFEGRSELFQGLAIERLETKWDKHAVLSFDFNTISRDRPDGLDERLNAELARYESVYGITPGGESYSMRLENLIHAAYKATGRGVVVLIDEYDKPMLLRIENGLDTAPVRAKLKAFYSVLKGEDEYLRFVLLTGVTRFSKVSVFSDLNNLMDISMSKTYAPLCGVTETELHEVFDPQIAELATECGMTKDECYAELRRRYDGYQFAYGTERIYNPFSLLNTLQERKFDSYWFATGTPTFLLTVMRRTKFDFIKGMTARVPADDLANVDTIDRTPLPVLFQSGYLTLKDYDPMFGEYKLDFPNAEVRTGFIRYALPYYAASGNDSGEVAKEIVRSVTRGDTDSISDWATERGL